MTYGKKDLTNDVMDEAGLSKEQAQKAVEVVFSGITQALKQGQQVRIMSFGAFVAQQVSQRQGRNPRTGEIIQIAASNRVSFKASIKLKRTLNDEEPSTVNSPTKKTSVSLQKEEIHKKTAASKNKKPKK